MTDGWVEVDDGRSALRAFGCGSHDGSADLLSALLVLPGSERWVRVEEGADEVSADEEPDWAMRVRGTRVYVNVTEARRLRQDVAVGGAAYLLSQSVSVTAAVSLTAKLVATVKVLSEDEVELVRVIAGLVPGNPYAHGVPESDVRAAYTDATVDVDQLLDALEAKKVVRKERIGRLRLVI